MKKVYRAPGYMELTLVLGSRCAPVRIEFTGGRSSGYGCSPAEFSTDDPLLQCLIESSPEYLKGYIV
ncbi:MAG: hypothetical protein K2M03_00080 [Muribaculaceae bacterium]|nr:hypothetical protein [Muribaculaceae bacterium]